MSVFKYQHVAEAPKVPPLAPPFGEGWQEDSRALTARQSMSPPRRSLVRDDDGMRPLSMQPLAPQFPEGWQPTLKNVPALSRSVVRDDDAMRPLSVPPLSPPFKEGFYSERFKLFSVTVSLVHDEQAMRPLSVQPLSPPFREGWESYNRKLLPSMAFVSAKDELLAPILQRLASGWDAAKQLTTATVTQRFRDAELPLFLSPSFVSFAAMEQSPAAIKPSAARRREDTWQPFPVQVIILPLREGWQSAPKTVFPPARSVVHDDEAMRPFQLLVPPQPQCLHGMLTLELWLYASVTIDAALKGEVTICP
jgi:hypothetical protein